MDALNCLVRTATGQHARKGYSRAKGGGTWRPAQVLLVFSLLVAAGTSAKAQTCPGGTVVGETGLFAICQNTRTGQRVSVPLGGDQAWDCTTAGLQFSPGDSIVQISIGEGYTPAPPAMPVELAACSPAPGSVQLQWIDTAFDETRVEVIHQFGFSRSLEADVTSTLVTGLDPGTSFHWQVRACNPSGCSPFTPIVGRTPDGVLTPPAVPANLVASSPAPGSVLLKWADTGCNEESFEVVHQFGFSRTIAAGVTSAFADGLDPGTSFHWQVRACNAAGCSAFTDIVGKTPDGACP